MCSCSIAARRRIFPTSTPSPFISARVWPTFSVVSGSTRLRARRGEPPPIVRVNAISATWPLLLGMGVLMLGAGLQGTLLGLRATLEGFPTLVTGVIISCYYVGYLLGTFAAPRLVRSVGHIRVFAAMAAVASAAILVQGSFVHPIPWALIRLVSGVCFAGIYVVAESWLNDRANRS